MTRKQRRFTQSNSQVGHAQSHDPQFARDYREAVQHLKEGRLQQSEQAHRRVLARSPRHAPSFHNLGLIAFKNNARIEAIDFIRQSLEIDPNSHQAWLSLALILGESRRLDEAIEACHQCLALQPSDAKSHAVLGNLLDASKHVTDAIAAYSESIKLLPNQPIVLTRMGELLLQSGEIDQAKAFCRRALTLDPKSANAQKLERRIFASMGQHEAAGEVIDARTSDPVERARLCDELGAFLRAQKRYKDAVPLQRRAVAYMPARADLHFNLATALDGAGQKEAALAAYQAGLAIAPEDAEAYAKVGALLRSMKAYGGAVTAYEHAVKLDPSLADAHYNLGTTYKMMSRYEEACAAFRRAIDCAPDLLVHHFELSNLRRMMCDWDGLDKDERYCIDRMRSTTMYVAPFLLISLQVDRADQLEAGRRFVASFAVPEGRQYKSYLTESDQKRRIRIGYLSGDFFVHATAMLLVEVLEKTDRDRFELFGYCYSPDDGSDLRRRIVGTFDRFVEIGGMSGEEAAKVIHDDGIDILVDLKGYTRSSRADILSYKPAPIQVSYLGYPGTLGADFVDYILADAIVAPMEHQEHYSERIVHLPNCYQPNDRQRRIADTPMTRAQFGLPEDAFVFCSFNNIYKLDAALFDIWMRLLGQVPNAVLWMLVNDNGARENLKREAVARGIDPARLVFTGNMVNAEHLARHKLADLFLDTLPCNAHTTASDALWAGLPVLTCIGDTFSGRVAASLLTAMNLKELIAPNLEEYERLALAFAQDRSRLEPIRQKIAVERDRSPLFDSARYTRNLERAYETMVDIMRAGEAPRPFAVVENQQPAVGLQDARVPYEQCPVCDAGDIPYQIEAKVLDHPLYKPELPPTVKWRSCADCGHFFTEGYFAPHARDLVYSSDLAHREVGYDAEGQRKIAARLIERVARYAPNGAWLDIGVGNGSLLFTAAEWGYEVIGADLRIEKVEMLLKLGFMAYWNEIEDIEAIDRFSVVSMVGMLDQMPFPKRALAAAHRMMRQGGALVLSMPNMDTTVWRILDASGANPHWGDIEHCHIFTRERLAALLEAQGFKVAEYNVSEHEPSAMDVIAIKT